MDLQECRRELDGIDAQLVELFENRMKVCEEVAEYKLAVGREVYDEARECQKLEAVGAMAHGDFNQIAVRELFSHLMSISRRLQYQKMAEHGNVRRLGFEAVDQLPLEGARVVYQGVEGAYGHAAALRYFGERADARHVPSFEDAMREAAEGRADYAVIPIENSSAGMVTDNYDLLAKYQNYIVAETFLPINHALLANPGTKLSEIRTVYSHPQALAQCSEYLNAKKGWRQMSLENTAVAAKKVIEDGDRTQAAVAGEMAARLYGLEVLESPIQNQQDNATRFLVLSNKPFCRADADKVSICFELAHRCGTLYNILGNFMFSHVNMLMIASRPIPGKKWEYRFFVDFEGKLSDMSVQNALAGIGEQALNLRILGNY